MTTAVLKRISVLAVTLSLPAQQTALGARAVELARQIPVSRLDAGLPRQTLSLWLTQTVGPAAKIRWEVSDCGEQSGNPDVASLRDFPLCVDAIANLPDDRMVIVSIVIGSFRKGIAGKPQLLSVNIGKGGRFEPVSKLRDLPARIKLVN
jgi:hypothetical protein